MRVLLNLVGNPCRKGTRFYVEELLTETDFDEKLSGFRAFCQEKLTLSVSRNP